MGPGPGRLHRRHRVDHHLFDRRLLIQQGVDEGGVGAVLQQAAHKVRQQVLVTADRCVDAQRKIAIAGRRRAIERLAHAMQALELGVQATLAGHQAHRRQSMGVVGGELAVEVRRGGQQRPRADQVGDVGRGLGGEDRIAGQAGDLGAFDLAVPVGALDQADHQSATAGAGDAGDGRDHLGATLLVGLYRQPQAAPGAQMRLAGQSVQDLQRDHQPVRLLGVEGQIDVARRRQHGQAKDAGIEILEHPRRLASFIARRERRELDRDPMAAFRARAPGGSSDNTDGVGVGGLIALGVGIGSCALPQHVEGTDEAVRVRPADGSRDGGAQHELFAHDPHRRTDRAANHRLAQAAGQPANEAGEIRAGLVVRIDQPPGQHQAPGRGVDQQGVRAAGMAGPVGGGDLLGDQAVAGFFVGGPQQRLRQAHEGQAFASGEAELLQEALDDALTAGVAAGGSDQRFGFLARRLAVRRRERARGQQGGDGDALVCKF